MVSENITWLFTPVGYSTYIFVPGISFLSNEHCPEQMRPVDRETVSGTAQNVLLV